MKKFLCFIGLHNWKCTTKSTSINGTIKEYFKCTKCSEKRMDKWKPNAKQTCGCNGC